MHPHGIWVDIQLLLWSCFTFCFLFGGFDFQNAAIHLGTRRVVDILDTLFGACFHAWFLNRISKLGSTREQTFILCYIYILICDFGSIFIFKCYLSLELKLKIWIFLRFYIHLSLRWLDAQDLWSVRWFSTLRKTLDAFIFVDALSSWLLYYRLFSLKNQR